MTWYPDGADVIALHNDLVELFAADENPIFPPGVKNRNLLESACTRPQTALGHTEKYGSIEEKAGALLHSLVKNHPFHNGNKRTGLVATVTFLWRNDRRLNQGVSDDDIFDMVVGVANDTFPTPRHGLDPDGVVQELGWWFKATTTALGGKAASMRTAAFLRACEAAGVTWKESGPSYVIRKGNRSVRISRSTRKMEGPVVREYLNKLRLVDIRVDEFQEGLSPEQAVMRVFRNVLRRLAHA